MFVDGKGRPLRGIQEEGSHSVKLQISMPVELSDRLEKYRADDERDRSWCIQKAVDEWLKKRGY